MHRLQFGALSCFFFIPVAPLAHTYIPHRFREPVILLRPASIWFSQGKMERLSVSETEHERGRGGGGVLRASIGPAVRPWSVVSKMPLRVTCCCHRFWRPWMSLPHNVRSPSPMCIMRSMRVSVRAYVCVCLNNRPATRRTLDSLAAKMVFYYSLAFEVSGRLPEARPRLLALHRTCCLR